MRGWHDDLRGRAHLGVPARPAGSGSGRAGSGAGCEGRGDRGAAAPAGNAAPAGGPAALYVDGSDPARDAGAAVAAGALAAVPGHPLDVAALAPGVGAPPLDLLDGQQARPTLNAPGRRRARRAAGPGEPALGYLRIVGE